MPQESNFSLTDLDYTRRRQALISYLRAQDDFLDYDFSGSTISLLLEILAYNNYNTSFALNMVANESFMDTANLRENIVKKARELGYFPRSIKAPFVDLDFAISSQVDSKVIIKAGSGFNTTVDDAVYTYVAMEDIESVANKEDRANFSARFYEGTYITQRFSYQNLRSQRFILNNQNIDTDTIKVLVGTTGSGFREYTRNVNIVEIDKTSEVYFIDEVEDKKYEISFGDGSIGKKPEDSSIISIRYIITSGPVSNNSKLFSFAGVVEAVDIDGNAVSLSALTTIPNPIMSESLGGTLPETTTQIKRNAKGLYTAQNRAVTIEDYKSIISKVWPRELDIIVYPGADKPDPEYGVIFVSVKSRDNEYISATEKEFIRRELKKYTLDSILVRVVDPSELYVELKSNITFNRSSYGQTYTLASIRNTVLSELQDYIRSESISDFNRILFRNKIINVIDNAQESFRSVGVDFTLRKDFIPLINTKAFYEVCYQNPLVEGTIISSPFDIISTQTYSQKVYIADDNNGLLNLHSAISFDPDVDPVVEADVGTVDYDDGEIMLHDLYILEHKGVVSIRAQSLNRDVRAERESFISVDLSESDFALTPV